MKIAFEYGDVVECDDNQVPLLLTIFGELPTPSEGGTTYVAGDDNTFGLPTTGHHHRKIGTDLVTAEKCRERYLAKVPNGLKDL